MGVKATHGAAYQRNQIGTFFPQHPEKCKNTARIEYKSRLERLCMEYLDKNSAVVSWQYEGKFIYYFDKITQKRRKYYIDFIAQVKVNSLITKTVWIEVKDKRETMKPGKRSNAISQQTWIRNNCKWEAAKKLAESQNISFVILTEDQLS